MLNRVKFALGMAFVIALPVLAVSSKFTEFTPLTSSATGLPVDALEEATPITLGNAKWSQRTVADRRTQNALVPNSNSGSWDMITSNQTGPDAGRYLFMPFETRSAGVQRIEAERGSDRGQNLIRRPPPASRPPALTVCGPVSGSSNFTSPRL